MIIGCHNYAMPLIRYRFGDRAVFGGRDKGVAWLRDIGGRSQVVVYSPDLTPHRPTASVLGRHYAGFEVIAKWKIEQREADQVVIRIVKGSGHSLIAEDEIKGNFRQLAMIEREVIYVEDIPRTARGKSKMLMQDITL